MKLTKLTKLTKKKVLIAVAVLAVLALAFWYGGDNVNSHGWDAQQKDAAEVEREAAPATSDPAAKEDPDESEPEPEAEPETAEEAEPEPEPEPEDNGMVIDPATGQDQYHTDPVPEGRPTPVEPQDATVVDVVYTCTISISCATILNNMEYCSPEKVELVPASGVILAPTAVTFYEGESVFDVLQRTCRQQGIHMEFQYTPIYNSAYIEGIANLYEFDVGQLSGWMYRVNGWFPNYGCSRYQLSNGDAIEWVYTCDLGYDVGGGYAVGDDE